MNDGLEMALGYLCAIGCIVLVVLGVGLCMVFTDIMNDNTNQASERYEKFGIANYEKAIVTDKLTNETYIVMGQGDRRIPLVVRLSDIATEAEQ